MYKEVRVAYFMNGQLTILKEAVNSVIKEIRLRPGMGSPVFEIVRDNKVTNLNTGNAVWWEADELTVN